VLDPEALKEHSWREVHIQLAESEIDEAKLLPLRDAIYSLHGQCKVILHLPLAEKKEALIEVGPTIGYPADDESLARLKVQPCVAEVWCT